MYPKKEIKIINIEKFFYLIPFLYRVYFGQKYQDLLLVIEQLKEQVREVLGDLAQCEARGGQLYLGSSPLFWLLVGAVAFSAGLGALRILWHVRRDGFFIVDR